MSRAWRLRPAPRPVEAWETEGSPAPHDSPVPCPRLLLGDAGDLMQGTPGQPLARRGAAPCQERGGPPRLPFLPRWLLHSWEQQSLLRPWDFIKGLFPPNKDNRSLALQDLWTIKKPAP